ncbi:MAG: Fic/DOC family N-terminal domain-containing protein [Burkholderiaceae bacterium]
MPSLLAATAALARHDQMLRGMHNSEIFLAPLRGQEAVISSRMEGTISTLDEILQLQAEFGDDDEKAAVEFRADVIETALYRRALNTAQHELQAGRCPSRWSKASAVSCCRPGAGQEVAGRVQARAELHRRTRQPKGQLRTRCAGASEQRDGSTV